MSLRASLPFWVAGLSGVGRGYRFLLLTWWSSFLDSGVLQAHSLGLKPRVYLAMRPKAEALGYLDAKATSTSGGAPWHMNPSARGKVQHDRSEDSDSSEFCEQSLGKRHRRHYVDRIRGKRDGRHCLPPSPVRYLETVPRRSVLEKFVCANVRSYPVRFSVFGYRCPTCHGSAGASHACASSADSSRGYVCHLPQGSV